MRLFGLDINIQRREAATGVPNSTMEGIKDGNNAQADKAAGSPTGGIVIANTAGELMRSPKTITDLENAIAAKQDALIYDTTPTSGSTNPVTSGGVKNAIDNAIAIMYFSAKPLIEDIFGDANLQKVDCRILNSTGSEASITDLFSISVGQTLYLPDNAPTIPNGKMVLLHLYRTATQGYFMVSIGGIYTIS